MVKNKLSYSEEDEIYDEIQEDQKSSEESQNWGNKTKGYY